MKNTIIENLKSRYVIRKSKPAAVRAAVPGKDTRETAEHAKTSVQYRRMHPLQMWASPNFFFHVTAPGGEKQEVA